MEESRKSLMSPHLSNRMPLAPELKQDVVIPNGILDIADQKGETAPQESIPKDPAEVSQEREEAQFLHGLTLYLLFSGIGLVGFLVALNAGVVVTAIPRITSDFHSIQDIGWYGSAYLFANCSIQPLTGKLYSLYSLKSTILIFLGIFELGSLLGGVSTSSSMFIVGRAVAGLGAGGLINGGLTIISHAAPSHKRPILISSLISCSTIGSMVGPLVGGVLTDKATWRWCFYLNLPLGGVTGLLLCFIRIPDPRVKSNSKLSVWQTILQLDPFGFVTFAPAVTMCLIALEWGGTTLPWGSPTIISLLCGSLIMFCIFIFGEYRWHENAMIPIKMISQRIVYFSWLTVFFQRGGLFLLIYYIPLWFQTAKGVSPTLSGVYTLPTVLSQMGAAMVSGWLVGRLGYYLPWAISGSALTSVGSGLMSLFTPSSDPGIWIGFQIILGIGRGISLQQPISAVQSVLPSSQIPQSAALLMFANYFGGALFVSFGNTLFSNRLVPALQTFAPTVNAQAIIDAGASASGINSVVSHAELPGVLLAFNQAVTQTFYLATGASIVSFFTSWGLGWKSVKKVKKNKPEA